MNDINLDFLNPVKEAEVDIDSISLESYDEGLLFLTALRGECTAEEYNKIVTEAATELELYGLIDSSDVVLESKNIVKLNKLANFNKVQKRTALRLAEKANDQLYEKYAKFRKLMIDARMKIFTKYLNKSKVEAKKAIMNAARKASAMKSSYGKTIVDKMDSQIQKIDKSGSADNQSVRNG